MLGIQFAYITCCYVRQAMFERYAYNLNALPKRSIQMNSLNRTGCRTYHGMGIFCIYVGRFLAAFRRGMLRQVYSIANEGCYGHCMEYI